MLSACVKATRSGGCGSRDECDSDGLAARIDAGIGRGSRVLRRLGMITDACFMSTSTPEIPKVA
jgi:hypothetical protein